MTAPLPFASPNLLAPMEGVTEPCFRDLVLARNAPDALGGAFTEFVRVVDHAVPGAVLARHLGRTRHAAPVGLQLMGSDADALAATARTAIELGAPLIDLNFGCPAKGAVAGCAGSALLRDPCAVERLVVAVARAAQGRTPVSAKIRAGYDDDARLEELARAVEAGGAALLTVHCRTRVEGYRDDAIDWRRIERAVAAVSIPVCGNGGVATPADFARMRERTGAAYAMAGRGALRDPWIFCGHAASATDAAAFVLEYFDALVEHSGFARAGALARCKQLLQHLRAGGLVERGGGLRAWLVERDPDRFVQRVREAAYGTRISSTR